MLLPVLLLHCKLLLEIMAAGSIPGSHFLKLLDLLLELQEELGTEKACEAQSVSSTCKMLHDSAVAWIIDSHKLRACTDRIAQYCGSVLAAVGTVLLCALTSSLPAMMPRSASTVSLS